MTGFGLGFTSKIIETFQLKIGGLGQESADDGLPAPEEGYRSKDWNSCPPL